MSYETLLEIIENADDPLQALKEHKEKQRRERASESNLNAKAVIDRAKNHAKEECKPNVTPEQIERIKKWLSSIGEYECDHFTILNKCRSDPEAMSYYLDKAMKYEQDKRAKKALAMLESHPGKHRAYTSDTETDPDNVILTCAIRDVATFEMLIPQNRYDPFLLTEMIHKDLIH